MDAFLQVADSVDGSTTEDILQAYLVASELRLSNKRISCNTEYPFSLVIEYIIDTDDAFNLWIRVPEWATNASTVQIQSQSGDWEIQSFIPEKSLNAQKRAYKMHVPTSRGFRAKVELSAAIQIQQFYDGTVSFYHGPLLYALEIAHTDKVRMPRNYKDQQSDCADVTSFTALTEERWIENVRDHELIPIAPWSVAVDLSTEVKFVKHEITRHELSTSAWDSRKISGHLEVSAYEVEWPTEGGTAVDPKDVDLKSVDKRKGFTAKLVPYGCAKLHMAQFPVV